MENIKEMRACEDGRYYRERFKLSKEMEERWLTIVHLADGKYKTLHLVAMTKDHFTMWHETLKELYAIRAELMTGLGNMERRQTLWERHYWKGADFSGDHVLNFEEVKRMCRRLNISTDDAVLKRRFDAADSKKSGKLDFEDFRRFVKGLKRRPEIKRLFRVLKGDGEFTFTVFEKFMCESQQVGSLPQPQCYQLTRTAGRAEQS
jgi:phosphatidylinositol phospholipase C delta